MCERKEYVYKAGLLYSSSTLDGMTASGGAAPFDGRMSSARSSTVLSFNAFRFHFWKARGTAAAPINSGLCFFFLEAPAPISLERREEKSYPTGKLQ